jgi:2-oxoglutarate dehydrogenase E1 component
MADDAGIINEVLTETSFLYGANAAFVEDLYAQWAANPGSVEASWAAFFASLHDQADGRQARRAQARLDPAFRAALRPDWLSAIDGHGRPWPAVEAKVAKAIEAKAPGVRRSRPRRHAGQPARHHDDPGLPDARPPGRQPRPAGPGAAGPPGTRSGDLRLLGSRLRPSDLPRLRAGPGNLDDPRDPVDPAPHLLRQCRRAVHAHLGSEEKAWLQERIEGRDKEIVFSKEGKVAILKKLIETEGFERFLHKRFPGTKRFGLDGGEAMVPAMEQIIKRGGALGVKDIVLGMPHRGRLNVLAAVMGKPYHVIFHEFQGGSSCPSTSRARAT